MEVVAVVVDDDADALRAFDAGGLNNVVAFGGAPDGENLILEELGAEALAGFDEDERNVRG